MTNPAVEGLVDARHRTLQIICVAILSSLAIYVGVAWVVTQQNPGGLVDGQGLPEALPMILAAVAVTTLVSGEALTKMLLARAVRGATPAERLAGHVQGVVVGFALRESVGVIGLVLSLLSGNLLWVVGLGVVAGAAMLGAWPRREQLVALAGDHPAPIG